MAKDDANRTPLGYFNFAETYTAAARTLGANPTKAPHRDEPVNLLYYQAIELYLKAFLRLHSYTPRELASRRLGHDFRQLARHAQQCGLRFKALDTLSMRFLKDTDAMANARYLKPGTGPQLTHARLDQMCRRLRHRVGNALKAKGESVRWLLPLP